MKRGLAGRGAKAPGMAIIYTKTFPAIFNFTSITLTFKVRKHAQDDLYCFYRSVTKQDVLLSSTMSLRTNI